MRENRVDLVDRKTGVVLGNMRVMRGATKWLTKLYGAGGFAAMAHSGHSLLAKDKDITKDAYRVFHFLCSCLDYDNWVKSRQVDVCKNLDMLKSNVSRAMRILVEKNVFYHCEKNGNFVGYRLNPLYGYMGNPFQKMERRLDGSFCFLDGFNAAVIREDSVSYGKLHSVKKSNSRA